MQVRLDSLGDDGDGVAGWPWLCRVAVSWVCGLVLAAQLPGRWVFVVGAGLALVAGWVLVRRGRIAGAQWAGLIALGLIAGAWSIVQRDYVARDHVARFVHEEPVLAAVRGVIVSEPRAVVPGGGAFGGFSFHGPGTLFELDLDAVDAGRGFADASGTLLVRIKQEDHRPALGQRIEATGWMSAIGPMQNPGEFDYRAYLREQGVSGRITLMNRDNWRALGPPPRWTLTGVRRSIGDAAARSMRLGLPDDAQRVGLLDALLLGRRTGDIDELSDSFRAVGLSHVLSISGAHLGILLLIVWALGRLLIGRPSVVAGLVLAALVLFLLAVPWRTPIVRAGIMAAVFCVGYGLGRRLTGAELLSAAAMIVLIWKPGDLFSAGFQLSFGVVGAILLFARPVSRWAVPEPEAKVVNPSAWDLGVRWVIDFMSVSVVAFAVALPMVMYHFQLVSPLAVLLTALAFLPLSAVLAVGYFKIIVGLVSPAFGSLLSVPLAWVSDWLSGLIVHAQRWPGASFTLWAQPTVGWALAAVGCIVALMGGWFGGRLRALSCCVLLLVGWAWVEQRPSGLMRGDEPSAMVLNMFAVGDGSCYLVRSGGETLMFDCGSQGYWSIGERSIVPALSAMGVRRVDTLMVSHADLDHYVGVLDLIEGVQVGRVLVSPDVLREAAGNERGAAAYLVEELRRLGYGPQVVERGWVQVMGEARLEVLWPAAGFASEKNNNNSLVLRIDAAGRRVLLNGDIQGEAIDALLEHRDELRADVTDLAHHGSFVDQSPAWLDAVGPGVVLQSSGPRRPEQDNWSAVLRRRGITRLWTAQQGMVELQIDDDGQILWQSHRNKDNQH